MPIELYDAVLGGRWSWRFRAPSPCPRLRWQRRTWHPAHHLSHLPRQRPGAICSGLRRLVDDDVSYLHPVRRRRQHRRASLPRMSGRGQVRRTRRVKVNAPAGVNDGSRLRASGQGEAGLHGGPPGDLLVYIRIRQHPRYTREGLNLICQRRSASLRRPGAIPGGDTGRRQGRAGTCRPAPRTAPACASGRGVPRLGSRCGDLLVRIAVETPRRLSPRQRELLEELAPPWANQFLRKRVLWKMRDVFGKNDE